MLSIACGAAAAATVTGPTRREERALEWKEEKNLPIKVSLGLQLCFDTLQIFSVEIYARSFLKLENEGWILYL